MADPLKLFRPIGLQSAWTHGAAVGQTRADVVYQSVQEADKWSLPVDGVEIDPRSGHAEHDGKERARAARLLMDRIERLGERYRENRDLTQSMRVEMKTELRVLEKDLERMFMAAHQGARVETKSSGLEQGLLSVEGFHPEMAKSVAEALFRGDLKLVDRVNKGGYLEDSSVDPLSIQLEGRAVSPRSSPRKIEDVAEYWKNRYASPSPSFPRPADSEELSSWLQSAVSEVQSRMTEEPKIFERTHGLTHPLISPRFKFGA